MTYIDVCEVTEPLFVLQIYLNNLTKYVLDRGAVRPVL